MLTFAGEHLIMCWANSKTGFSYRLLQIMVLATKEITQAEKLKMIIKPLN